MSEQRGHGPTEQREWGEGWPKGLSVSYCDVCDDPDDLLKVPDEACRHGYDESHRRHGVIQVVPLSEAEAALSRVEGERDELAAHLERVRERVWPYRSENEYDPGSTPGPPPDRYFEGVGDLADAVLSLLPDPKGER